MPNPTQTITVLLAFPIATPSGEVTRITMRRAKVKDLRRMKDFGTSDADQEIGLMAHLSGLTTEDFDLIDAADYHKLQDSFRGLLGYAQPATVVGDGAAGEVVSLPAE